MSPGDWLVTVELFSEHERPGWREFVAGRSVRLAAVFHDAIPLRLPDVTWPQSVQRHPEYMKTLAAFDRVWAVSKASLEDLTGFWRWQGTAVRAAVSTLELGADFDGSARQTEPAEPGGKRPQLLCVGIVEPRKNQAFLAAIGEQLWNAGLDFDLHVVGRTNPHFGAPMVTQLKRVQSREQRLHVHGAIDDRRLHTLYAGAALVLFPTVAEGCGLPLLESLWRGVPCVASDLPSLRESAASGGCALVPPNDAGAWVAKLRELLVNPAARSALRVEAVSRPLPRWKETAQALLDGLSR
ncbi:MAG TPA: glycosyltransferase [Candidatus Didemnitutus sp.]|nr:glycosyltransferase [Candidatus Didemnitutus sp.]